MPLTVIVPAVGCSRSAMTRRSVVLPQPDGPMNETNSPLGHGEIDVGERLDGAVIGFEGQRQPVGRDDASLSALQAASILEIGMDGHHTPVAGMPLRSTLRGAVISFHVESARFTA